jgi:hypothetical protein
LVAPAPFHFPGFAAIQQEGGLSLFQKAPPPDR